MRFSQFWLIWPGLQCTRGRFQEQKWPSFLLVELISTLKDTFLSNLRYKFNGRIILEMFNKCIQACPDSSHERSESDRSCGAFIVVTNSAHKAVAGSITIKNLFQWVFKFNKGNIPMPLSYCYNKRILTYEVFAILAHLAWFTVHKRVFPGAEMAFVLVGRVDKHIKRDVFKQSLIQI